MFPDTLTGIDAMTASDQTSDHVIVTDRHSEWVPCPAKGCEVDDRPAGIIFTCTVIAAEGSTRHRLARCSVCGSDL